MDMLEILQQHNWLASDIQHQVQDISGAAFNASTITVRKQLTIGLGDKWQKKFQQVIWVKAAGIMEATQLTIG
jgi:hypothetical protein